MLRKGLDGKKGGFRKVADWSNIKSCKHPEHNPPGYICLKPGVYEYTCPSCGQTTTVTIHPEPTMHNGS